MAYTFGSWTCGFVFAHAPDLPSRDSLCDTLTVYLFYPYLYNFLNFSVPPSSSIAQDIIKGSCTFWRSFAWLITNHGVALRATATTLFAQENLTGKVAGNSVRWRKLYRLPHDMQLMATPTASLGKEFL